MASHIFSLRVFIPRSNEKAQSLKVQDESREGRWTVRIATGTPWLADIRMWAAENKAKLTIMSKMITLSTVIGTGLLNGGSVLRSAGPGGEILSLVVVGLVVICVMEGISEMIQKFSVPNALVVFVRTFVDEELAHVVAFAHWFTYASIVQVQATTAARQLMYWKLSSQAQTGLQVGVFCILWTFAIIQINVYKVKRMGWIEGIGGVIKLLGFIIITYIMCYLAGIQKQPKNLRDGFRANSADHDQPIRNSAVAVFYAIIPTLFSFVGVEAVSVTAYEARSLKDLRQPSKIIAILVLTIYLPYTLAEGIGISWKSPWLPRSYGDPGLPQNGTETVYPAPVIVAMQVHVDSIANFFEAFIIYAAFSTSNASLYIASRILYGSAEYASHDAKWLQHFTRIWSSGVPRWCVLASALSFWWVPFSQLVHNQSTENLIELINVAASVSAAFVWGAGNLAYIRYFFWLRLHKTVLVARDEHVQFNRWKSGDAGYAATTLLFSLQPIPSFVGFVGCFGAFFVFTTALLWSRNGPFSGFDFFHVYTMPILLLTLWVVLKVIRYFRSLRNHDDFEMWKKLGPDEKAFLDTLYDLYYQSSTKRVSSTGSAEMPITTTQRSHPNESQQIISGS